MGEVAGYLGTHIVLDECYIANIAVREKFRRKGIADMLLSVGEKNATDKNCAFISLEVRVSNEKAIALYKKRGYNEVGERKNFYSDPTENALIMTKNFSED
jgi:ribosomal-protein-alanine N-acetyltransferase